MAVFAYIVELGNVKINYFLYVGVFKVFDKNVDKTVKSTRYPKEASNKVNKT